MVKISERFIDSVIDNSDNPALVEEVISNNFSGLDRPCSISISVKSLYDDNSFVEGLKSKEEIFDDDILRIVNMLRENGIDAVPYNSVEAADIRRFVVDRSGIVSPMLSSEDAVQAVADITDILQKNNEDIKGYVFPKTKESLTYYTNKKNHDIVANNENSALAKQISDKYGMTVEQFSDKISQEISKLPEIDVKSRSQSRDYTTCFRGGTFGSNPYAVLANRRSKDCAYYTPVMDTALDYSHGLKDSIGFIAEIQTSDDQKFYNDWGLETRGSEVKKLKNAYETLGLAYKNPVKAMYMVKNGKTYQIANENGFISKEIELFAKLHDGKSLADNEIMCQRGNTLKEIADTDINQAVTVYDKSFKLEPFSHDLTISAKDYIQQNFREPSTSIMANGKYNVDDVAVFGSWQKPRKTIDKLIPDCIKDIKFKRMNIVNAKITGSPILDNIENLTLSFSIIENDKNIPNGVLFKHCYFNKETDLSHLESAEFTGRSLSDNKKLPKKVTFNKVTLGRDIDFRGLKELNFKNMSIDTINNLKLPKKISLDGAFFENTKIPLWLKFFKKDKNEMVSFGKVEELSLKNMHIDTVKKLRLPEKITLNNISFEKEEIPKWKVLFKKKKDERVDFTQVKELKLENVNLDDLHKLKISKGTKIKLSGAITIKDPSTLAFLQKYNIDVKDVSHINLFAHKRFINEAKKGKIKLPNDIPLVWKNNGKLEVVSKSTNKEFLNGYFGGMLIEQATFKTPEEFKQKENISLETYLSTSSNTELNSHLFADNGVQKVEGIEAATVKENAAISEPKVEKVAVKSEKSAAERISQLRGVNQSSAAAKTGENIIEKVAEKTVVHAGVNAGKTSEGIIDTLAKADNAVNQAIDKTIDKGSELLNNTAVGKAYEKATDAIANTKVVKAVEKGAAKTVEKAAQTAVGKSVVKAVAKTTGSAVGKSVLKKVPLVSVAAGCYFAWDRVKDGDWKGACGEVASGVAGCFPGVGTGISAAIDVGLAAKDIGGAITRAKEPEGVKLATEEKSAKSMGEMRQIILQKQGRVAAESKTPVKPSEISNQVLQQKIIQQGRG